MGVAVSPAQTFHGIPHLWTHFVINTDSGYGLLSPFACKVHENKDLLAMFLVLFADVAPAFRTATSTRGTQ